jgi:hypothetical protein
VGGVSLPRELHWFVLGVARVIPCDAWCSSVGLPNVFQAGLEPASGSMAALQFSHCNMAWRSFLQAKGLGGSKFWFSMLFYFHQVWLQHLSKVLESQSSRCLLLHPSHHLGSLAIIWFLNSLAMCPGWPWTCNPPALAFQVVKFQ